MIPQIMPVNYIPKAINTENPEPAETGFAISLSSCFSQKKQREVF